MTALAQSSALDFANGATTRINATITIAKLNLIQMQLDGVDRLSTSIYGVVYKVMRTDNGETMEMARQFDMI
ncbi:MAG TPA: hypothetical protein VJZ68_04935 [Nitrososphaera sp.]|nr:hypothetical protein [Nitrososphaera sp.]